MVRRDAASRILAGTIALLGWFALAAQFALLAALTTAKGGTVLGAALQYLGYFTILTNLLTASVMSAIVLRGGVAATLQAGMTLSIAVVGIIYSLVLRALWAPTGWQKLVDALLHDVIPVLAVAHWAIFGLRGVIGWRDLPLWLAWPTAFLVVALVRGAIDGWYPYPFLDAGQLGYAMVLRNALAITALFAVLAAGLIGLDRVLASIARRLSSRSS